MHKIKKAVRITFVLTALFILSILVGSVIGSELSYKITPEYNYSPISYTQTALVDNHFVEQKEYSVGGVDGRNISTINYLKLGDAKIQLTSENKHIDPINKFIFKGALPADELKTLLQKKLDLTTTELKAKNDSEKYNNLVVENLVFGAENNYLADSKIISLGTIEVFMQNCNFFNTIEVKYNLSSKDYEFNKLTEFENNLCIKYTVPDSPLPTSCTDCTYYPVDKKHPLDSSYSVEVINADAVPGDQRFSKDAYPHLLNLYAAAKAAGHNMRLTSAYRSYQDQQEVYEGWVQYEMGFGKSRAQAESDANSYSALPGFSEHQLGTTADISSLDCIGIETACHANELFWDWLKDHAYEYGFIMSYPMGKDNLTGYIHEPWHYRYIGMDLAKEFKEKYESRSYLAEFLRNKKLY